MFAETDIAARIIWLRKAEYCVPRIVDATRCTFRVNACAFRQTLSFLKSLIQKDGLSIVVADAVSVSAGAFRPKFATPTRPVAFGAQRKSASRAAGSSVVLVSRKKIVTARDPALRQCERDERPARRL
jgi:hypothetical protein